MGSGGTQDVKFINLVEEFLKMSFSSLLKDFGVASPSALDCVPDAAGALLWYLRCSSLWALLNFTSLDHGLRVKLSFNSGSSSSSKSSSRLSDGDLWRTFLLGTSRILSARFGALSFVSFF